MKLFIKDMFSPQDLSGVKNLMNELDIDYDFIDYGEVILADKTPRNKIEELKNALQLQHMQIVTEKKSILIERIKAVIVKMILFSDELPAENYSIFISNLLQHNYTYLANIFSAQEKITIEHFIINYKVEKVKRLLRTENYSLTEIALKMHYSSVAHLANQFKKVTGQTTTAFKREIF